MLKAVALPVEHGGYGILLEAVLVGLGLAPTAAGVFYAFAFLAAFFMAQPAKVLLSEKVPLRVSSRRKAAILMLAVYGLPGAVFFLLGLNGTSASIFPALYVLLLFAAYQMLALLGRKNREFLTTVTGSMLLSAAAVFILLAGGSPLVKAVSVWILLGARAISAISYVRFRLRAARGDESGLRTAWTVHGVSGLIILALVLLKAIPVLAAAGYFLIAARNAYVAAAARAAVKPQVIGFQQFRLSLFNALLIIFAFSFGF